MLGRTANGLFWMFRYIERAENIARLIDAGMHMALTHYETAEDEWSSVISSAGVAPAYYEANDVASESQVIDFLLRSRANPFSVLNAVDNARNNARMVRTALTREAWESVNEFWLEMTKKLKLPIRQQIVTDVLDAIKRHTAHIRGAFHGTMLRNDIFSFAELGTYVERADNTSRILDVKYYVLLPSVSFVGSTLDNTQWESILRSVSAHKSYHWMYDDTGPKPRNIADYLILNGRMPRSLAFCYNKICESLDNLTSEYDDKPPVQDLAAKMLAKLKKSQINDVFDEGLHEFLQDFIQCNNKLANQVSETYRFY